MKYKLYTLLALSCLFFSSCSKETLGNEASTEQAEGKTQTVKMSLGAGFSAFDKEGLEESPESELKALEKQNLLFEIRDGNNKFILGDNGKPFLENNAKVPSKRGYIEKEDLKGKAANIKFFVQVRKKNTTTIVGSLYQKWDYQSRNTTDWRLNGVDIPLTGVTPGTDELQVRIVAGGNLDAEKGEIVIPKPEYQELDLSKSNKISLPVPFVSNWIDLHYDGAQYTTVGGTKIKLKPLGVLLVTTVRSTMRENVSLTGVRYVSNALAFQGKFTLDGSDNVLFTASGAHKFITEVTEDDFYEITYNFKEKMTPARTPNNSKVIVSWALPTGKPKAEAWATNKNQKGDITNMISMPQTHVYAEGVTRTDGSKVPTNFNIAPIMGTNHNFGHAKSAAINCELYDTPRQILGYFAHYTVNKEGTGFDTSHEPSQVSLVNWKVAKDFLKGKELTGPNGQKAIYTMGRDAMAVYTGVYLSSVWFVKYSNLYNRLLDLTDPSKGSLSARERPVYVNKGTDENPNITQEDRRIMMVYIPKRKDNVQYMIIGRQFTKDRTQSKDQVVIRIEAEHAPKSLDGNAYKPFSVGSRVLTFVSLGKYFVGTAYSPIYNNKSAYDEDLWNDPVFLQGRVQRRMPSPGRYVKSSWEGTAEVHDVDNLEPDNKQREHVGDLPVYWMAQFHTGVTGKFNGPASMMRELHNGKNTNYNGADWLLDTQWFPPERTTIWAPAGQDGSMLQVNRDAKYMWQALWPIANKYQGDNIDPD